MDDILSGTLGTVPAETTKQPYSSAVVTRIRRRVSNMLASGDDPNFVRYAMYRLGYDLDSTEKEIGNFNKAKGVDTSNDEKVNSWANAINNKVATLQQAKDAGVDVDKLVGTLSPKVGPEEQKMKLQEEKVQNTVPVLDQRAKDLEDLKSDWYLDTAVGANKLGRVSALDWATGGRQDFISKVQQIVDQETLDKLIEVKGEGATFGALSDSEREALKKAATKIGTWEVRDDEGKVVGYKIGEEDFKEELDRLKKNIERRKQNIEKSNNDSSGGITSSGLKYIIEP